MKIVGLAILGLIAEQNSKSVRINGIFSYADERECFGRGTEGFSISNLISFHPILKSRRNKPVTAYSTDGLVVARYLAQAIWFLIIINNLGTAFKLSCSQNKVIKQCNTAPRKY